MKIVYNKEKSCGYDGGYCRLNIGLGNGNFNLPEV